MPDIGNVAALVRLVQRMVQDSGEHGGFNAKAWLCDWLEQPNGALGGRRPADVLDEPGGQDIIVGLLRRGLLPVQWTPT